MKNLFIGTFTDKDKKEMCNPGLKKKLALEAKKEKNKEYYDKKKKK